MSTMFGDDSVLFQQFVKGRKKAIFPWSLSIVDCFFLYNAFKTISADCGPMTLKRISDNGKQVEFTSIKDAYDLYDVDSDADGVEVVLLHESSRALCYWDVHERFVVVAGEDNFLSVARPYPADIEKHRYVETMLHLEEASDPNSPESIYAALIAS
ncbi:hypothetical protein [[Pseudomonas] boreopolis]|uniref:hypothetical protein n=1 Tax=Xanthomonas boreopolis TaxID=86183 RepID=UPI003D9FF095